MDSDTTVIGLPSYYAYWGKVLRSRSMMDSEHVTYSSSATEASESNPTDYHLLVYHSLDVAAVGMQLMVPERPLCKALAELVGITPVQLQRLFGFLLTLHDLGKFAAAFQNLHQIEDAPLTRYQPKRIYSAQQARHDRLGWGIWCVAEDDGYVNLTDFTQMSNHNEAQLHQLDQLLDITLGHHGKPILHGSSFELEDFWVEENVRHASEFIHAVSVLFQTQGDQTAEALIPSILLHADNRMNIAQMSWHLAGAAILADWLGSDNQVFPYCREVMPLEQYWTRIQPFAAKTVEDKALVTSFIANPFHGFEAQFQFSPTPLQKWVEQVPLVASPQLFILEDVTGSGKTEAALALTQRLMAAGQADGFYFGLPSMATSNAMFDRVKNHYHNMYQDKVPSLVLAHGASGMQSSYQEIIAAAEHQDLNYQSGDFSATATCHQWFSDSKKKALLAPVGVGTIDQALLAVLPRRHQPLRLLGLHRKVLIFDEVHAADEFMMVLLDDLLRCHARQGGSVILLTATLAKQQRQNLVRCWLDALNTDVSIQVESEAFPLVTQVSVNGVCQEHVETRRERSREVRVEFLHHAQACLDTIRRAVENNQSVVWVRNSVEDVVQAHRWVEEQVESVECQLFHSRFTLLDRQHIEHEVLACLGKTSQPEQRRGRVIITSQVFQESLDADADVMISDICPIDDLIQRSGRLHRHERDHEGNFPPKNATRRPAPTLYLHCPHFTATPEKEWLSAQFRHTQAVYRSPGRLWLGLRILMQQQAIRMPEEARLLIESVYSSEATQSIPEALQEEQWLHDSEVQHKTNVAYQQKLHWEAGYSCDSARQWYEDESEISTRYSDIAMVQVVVLKRGERGEILLWAEGQSHALELSQLKLPQHHADKLADFTSLHPGEAQPILQRYRQAKFMRLWLAEEDADYHYSATEGFQKRRMV